MFSVCKEIIKIGIKIRSDYKRATLANRRNSFLEWFLSTTRVQKEVELQFVSDQQNKSTARDVGTAQNRRALIEIVLIKSSNYDVNKLALQITTHS